MIPLVIEFLLTVLIGGLDDPRHRTRETAHRNLRLVGESATPMLAKYRHSDCREIAVRCQQLLNEVGQKWAWRTAEHVYPGRWLKQPWISFDGGYGHETGQQFLRHVHDKGQRCGDWHDGWQDWRLATRHWVAAQLLTGRDQDVIRFDLAVMADVEVNWMLQNVYYHLAPYLPWRI